MYKGVILDFLNMGGGEMLIIFLAILMVSILMYLFNQNYPNLYKILILTFSLLTILFILIVLKRRDKIVRVKT